MHLFSLTIFSQNCITAIRSDIELPTAYHLSKGNWIMSLIEPFTMNIICRNTNRQQLLLKLFFKITSLASGVSDHSYSPAARVCTESTSHSPCALTLPHLTSLSSLT